MRCSVRKRNSLSSPPPHVRNWVFWLKAYAPRKAHERSTSLSRAYRKRKMTKVVTAVLFQEPEGATEETFAGRNYETQEQKGKKIERKR